jgi:hypothetical protein
MRQTREPERDWMPDVRNTRQGLKILVGNLRKDGETNIAKLGWSIAYIGSYDDRPISETRLLALVPRPR